MNNDLISRSAVIKIIEDEIKLKSSYVEHNAQIDIMFKVKEMPIAYDVDKVVDKLKNVSIPEDKVLYANPEEFGQFVLLKDVVKITKFGGVERGENMRYKCIKELCLPKCDGDGFEIPNEYGFVEVGSIWERDDEGNMVGGDVHLDSLDDDSDFGWVEMPFEELKENFVLIE